MTMFDKMSLKEKLEDIISEVWNEAVDAACEYERGDMELKDMYVICDRTTQKAFKDIMVIINDPA